MTLEKNYPNPFNLTKEITYGIPVAGLVKFTVFNCLGREVKVLVNELNQAGTYTVQFNGES